MKLPRLPLDPRSRTFVIVLAVVVVLAVLLFSLRGTPFAGGTARYVAPNGVDSGGCTDSTTPCRTLDYVLDASRCGPGDTIWLAGGSYAETGDWGGPGSPSDHDGAFCVGDSWESAVTIRSQSRSSPAILSRINYQQTGNSAARYHIWRDVVFDPRGREDACVRLSGQTHHIRMLDSELRNSTGSGCWAIGTDSHHNELLGTCGSNGLCSCKVHDNGNTPQLDHGAYISGDDNLVQGCEFYNNLAYGIQLWDEPGAHTGNRVIANHTYSNGLGHPNGGGIVCGGGGSAVIANNIVDDNLDGILVSTCGNSTVLNNTIYRNQRYGLEVQYASGYTVSNNIIRESGAADQRYLVSVNASNNLCHGTGGSQNPPCSRDADPGFVDPANGDFRLASADSPAHDAAMTVAAVQTPIDFDGDTRDQTWDIGAQEYLAGTPIPPDPPDPEPEPLAASLSYVSVGGSSLDKHAVCAGPCRLTSLTATNTNSSARHLRCRNDRLDSVTPGNVTADLDLAIRQDDLAVLPPDGVLFDRGLTCWLTTGAAPSNTQPVAANEVKVFYTLRPE